MSTAILPSNHFPFSPIIYSHFHCHVIHKLWCDRRGPSGSIMVKISLDGSNYLFCASAAGQRKWSRNWASQPTPTDLRQMRRQSGPIFDLP